VPVWTPWRRKKLPFPIGNQTLAVQPIAIAIPAAVLMQYYVFAELLHLKYLAVLCVMCAIVVPAQDTRTHQ
jgi:hypothetical protein